MAAYNGTRNLREHAINYKMFIGLQTHLDAFLCKVFPTTLIGTVQTYEILDLFLVMQDFIRGLSRTSQR